MAEYVELHCHSGLSLLDGASNPEALIQRASELGYHALALTDHDELGGAVRFAEAANQAGLRGIIGAELTITLPTLRSPLSASPLSATHLTLLAETREGYGNLSTLITRARMDAPRGNPSVTLDLLAQHARGLFALTGCMRGWVPSHMARNETHEATEAAATLIDIFEGRVAIECWDHHLAQEREVVAKLIPLAHSLGIPWVVTNDVHYASPKARIIHDVLCALKHERTLDEMGKRLRPSGEWYLKSPDQMRRRWQHAPEGIAATLPIAERCEFRMNQLKPTLPAFPLPPGITGDEYLARLVEQGARERWGDGAERYMDPGLRRDDSNHGIGHASNTIGGTRRTPAHDKQIKHELDIIARLGLAGYFLIVWDIVRFAHREGVLCQGRGSAANSAVCYCLGITAVDPIRMELLFERFLSEERREAPDIDIDFAHRDREKVLQYVYQRYGREHAAMVCEQITYRGKSAVRDTARVLGFSVEQADKLSLLSDRFSARATGEALRVQETGYGDQGTGKSYDLKEKDYSWPMPKARVKGNDDDKPELITRLRGNDADSRDLRENDDEGGGGFIADALASMMVPGTEATTKSRAIKEEARSITRGTDHVNDRREPLTAIRARPRPSVVLKEAGLDPKDRRVKVLADVVSGLHQLPRHRSIHVGGFVLTEEPLSTVVPIEPASMPDRTVIQWEKDDLDPVSLVKIDLLGLGILTLIQDCLVYIRQTRGVTIDLGQLDMTDQAVFDDMCAGDTIGVFQIESRAQMNTLPRLKPRCFYDLVVEVALIRPGPIQGDMVHPYLRRRAGVEKITYPHPSLEQVLKRTMGVPLFQEQGMQVAIVAAGFTPGEADTLRKAMGHKRSHERMAAICEKLVQGMKRNGIPEDIALRIYNQINAFADYGFPESHAASFALIVYASAYLRHYYAPEFTAAILNAQPMGFYSVGTLIEDGKRHGVEVRPIDLTQSAWETTLEMPEPNAKAAPGKKSSGGAPAVRLGLRLVRGLGSKARDKLEAALADGSVHGHSRCCASFEAGSSLTATTRRSRRVRCDVAERAGFEEATRGVMEVAGGSSWRGWSLRAGAKACGSEKSSGHDQGADHRS